MSVPADKELSIFAPAKINLYLHVTERLPSGYHALDSLIVFADIGDTITFKPSDHFDFNVEGEFAGAFSCQEIDTSMNSNNLVVKAARSLAQKTQRPLDCEITLTKNLPLGAGIGGGSADAAAVLWGLLSKWGVSKTAPYLNDLMLKLGADVPVCFWSRPCRIRGIGDQFDPLPPVPEMPIILVHPGKPCLTQEIFSKFNGTLKMPQALPSEFADPLSLVSFLQKQDNDLYDAARQCTPEIENALQALEAEQGCLLQRMSGSGSTCFGLFDDFQTAEKAAENIQSRNPDWWVKPGAITVLERY